MKKVVTTRLRRQTLSLWKGRLTVDDLDKGCENTLVENLGIEVTEVGDDWIKASMPVDKRTMQPFGMLHGGASLALAESLGSVAGLMSIDRDINGLIIVCTFLAVIPAKAGIVRL